MSLPPRVTEGVFDPVEALLISRPFEHALRFAQVQAALRPLDTESSPESFASTVPVVFTP